MTFEEKCKMGCSKVNKSINLGNKSIIQGSRLNKFNTAVSSKTGEEILEETQNNIFGRNIMGNVVEGYSVGQNQQEILDKLSALTYSTVANMNFEIPSKQKMESHKRNLYSKLNRRIKEYKKISKGGKLSGNLENAKLERKSNSIYFYIWMVSAIVMGGLTLNKVFESSD
tara:strand:- start:148 stop:657 length:510 start_codon:yes stop_codon:yes gene_type:complete